MSDAEQISAFAAELDALVERYREEFDLTYAAVVGALHMKAFEICREAEEPLEDDDDDLD